MKSNSIINLANNKVEKYDIEEGWITTDSVFYYN